MAFRLAARPMVLRKFSYSTSYEAVVKVFYKVGESKFEKMG